MTEKLLCTIDNCDYCPYLENIFTNIKHAENPLIDADFYKCNRLQICVEAHKIGLKDAKKHLFSFCPLDTIDEELI